MKRFAITTVVFGAGCYVGSYFTCVALIKLSSERYGAVIDAVEKARLRNIQRTTGPSCT